MDYRALNNNQRLRMNQICKNSISLEWEDPSFMEILSGKLPAIKKTSKDSVIKDELFALESVYDKYDYSKTDQQNNHMGYLPLRMTGLRRVDGEDCRMYTNDNCFRDLYEMSTGAMESGH